MLSIGEAAKAVHMTPETLRHYDRIGLVQPSCKDAWTKYRYYTSQDLVRLQTVHALQQMDLSLEKIKEILSYQDLEKIVAFLTEAEKVADAKIAALQHSKAKIQLARADYEKKLRGEPREQTPTLRIFPPRTLLLSEDFSAPSVENLWQYLSHFYDHIPPAQRADFQFEDIAGIYSEDTCSRLYAVCLRYSPIPGLKHLPGGGYLCLRCNEENRLQKTAELVSLVQTRYHVSPSFTLQQVVVSGILHWIYEAQVFVGPDVAADAPPCTREK